MRSMPYLNWQRPQGEKDGADSERTGCEVMAIPGSPLDPRAAGTNRLIQQGASLIRSAEDVIDIVTGLGQRSLNMPSAPEFETGPPEAVSSDQIARVREALSYSPTSLNEIACAADIGAARCAAILMELEFLGDAVILAGGLAVLTVSEN